MKSTAITACSVISAVGEGVSQTANAVLAGQLPAFSLFPLSSSERAVMVARVPRELMAGTVVAQAWDCENNRVAKRLLDGIADEVNRCVERFGAKRVGVVLGSSTAGIAATEQMVFGRLSGIADDNGFVYETQHAMGSLSAFVAHELGLGGVAYTISTACSSAAKTFLSARTLLEMGVADAVICGGVDTLCQLTVNGFTALGQTSERRTIPMSANRNGLNIGEGGAFFVMTREPGPIRFAGGGESLDAHHMSAPHPGGRGALQAMERALADGGVSPSEISYINLHGTATKANDAMESLAVSQLFNGVPCSATKPFTGHCLGAAGAVEAAICIGALIDKTRRLPPHLYDGTVDAALPELNLVRTGDRLAGTGTSYFLSNSFAFGGNNCSLLFLAEGV